MVKGTSRQVILVQGPEEKLFEQAIFILKDEAVSQGITEELLLKEAKSVLRGGELPRKGKGLYLYGAVWAAGGALVTGLAWILTMVLTCAREGAVL